MQLPAILENLIIAVSTAGITWFFSRKKQNVEVESSELDNVEKAIAIWRGLAQDLGKKVDDLSSRCESLSIEIDELRKENRGLKADLKKAIATYHPNN